ncbi:MAG: DUF501 domain-containing protein [Halothermotrichaceae bacterium]
MKVEKEEKKIIDYQLGRKAENVCGVAKYCPFNKPAVLITHPYNDSNNKIYPTLYWLSCPYIVRAVSRLEDEGLVQEYTLILQEDEKFRGRLFNAHQNYAQKRFAYLSEDNIEDLETISPDLVNVIKESGVGGIREKEGIKCLHTHLADYLADGKNPVGRAVWSLLRWPSRCDVCELEDK